MQQPTKTTNRDFLKSPWVAGFGLAVLLLILLAFGGDSNSEGTVFAARRGPLTISVLEGGSIEALESQVIRSEIEGREGTRILKIIEEGYRVTNEDVEDGLILVELDSSALEDRITAQEIDFQSTLANVMETMKEKEVQENRNVSQIKSARFQAKFALMDFEKYLGAAAAEKILTEIDLNEDSVDRMISDGELRSESFQFGFGGGNTLEPTIGDALPELLDPLQPPEPFLPLESNSADALLPDIKDYDIDFSIFADDENEALLGDGEARQELRKLKDTRLIAESEYALRKKAYEGAVRLADEGYLTPNELQEKKITYEKSENALASARASLELFKTYDLQKNAEQFLLNYEQALLELSRIKKDAIAEIADSIGRLNYAKRRHSIEERDLRNLRRQLAKCVIRAERPGLVVYGEGNDRWDPDEIIREGTMVRQRQPIITIPDMRRMALTVRIHESQIKRIEPRQRVRVTVDAESDRLLSGIVSRVGVLPDSENRRFNPDQKVYKTTVTIEGAHSWLKPGMTAQAEIILRELQDIVYVPVQAVTVHEGKTVCFFKGESGPEIREVEVEDYNNRFAAIRRGLSEGDEVFLHVPDGMDLETDYPDSPILPAIPNET